MNSRSPITNSIVLVVMIVIIAPTLLLAVPRHAAAEGCVGGLIGGVIGYLTSGSDSVPNDSTTEDMTTAGTMGATFESCWNTLIVVPAIHAAEKAVLQKMTAGVLQFISGGLSGQPAFVVNLAKNLRTVGDAVALPFIKQTATQFNSPFGSAISTALKKNYTQQTSLAGFFGANKCTLSTVSQNPTAFVAGNWSQNGGVKAWFALTTEPQNNPYTLYSAAQSQLESSKTQAQTNRRQEVSQSNGFLNWCGGSAATTDDSSDDTVDVTDPCTVNGIALNTMTPGTAINGYLQKIQGIPVDEMLGALSSLDNNIDSALSSVMTDEFSQILGGNNGLAGVSTNVSSRTGKTLTDTLNNYQGNTSGSNNTASAAARTRLDTISSYLANIKTITTAATTASTSLQTLADACASAELQYQNDPLYATTPTAVTLVASAEGVRQAALTAASQATTTITQMQEASASVVATQALAVKVQSETSGTTAVDPVQISTDISGLTSMPPSLTDVANAQSQATVGNSARSDATYAQVKEGKGTATSVTYVMNADDATKMLTVSSGTLVDRMNLITTNAQQLMTESSCMYTPLSSLQMTTQQGGS